MSSTDFIQSFIDIENFDASLVINPDSVAVKEHSARIFENYITSQVEFRMLSNKQYFTKTFSSSTDPETLRVEINFQTILLYATNNYPLFSFDIKVNFKNAEVIKYSRAVCEETGFDEEDITESDMFTKYDIFYIMMNDDNFLNVLYLLGYNEPFDVSSDEISLPPSELLNLVARKEWKFRVRLNRKNYTIFSFDGNNFYTSAKNIQNIASTLYDIPELEAWLSEVF